MPEVIMSFRDDWLVHVLLADLRVYSFQTEMWPEHGIEADRNRCWPAVIRSAEACALHLGARAIDTWRLDRMPADRGAMRRAVDQLARSAPNIGLRRYLRH